MEPRRHNPLGGQSLPRDSLPYFQLSTDRDKISSSQLIGMMFDLLAFQTGIAATNNYLPIFLTMLIHDIQISPSHHRENITAHHGCLSSLPHFTPRKCTLTYCYYCKKNALNIMMSRLVESNYVESRSLFIELVIRLEFQVGRTNQN